MNRHVSRWLPGAALCVAGLFAPAMAQAQTGVAADTAQALPRLVVAPPVPLLWKACDSDNCVYLLGSFHLLKAEDYPLSADVQAAFDDAESVLFEMPPSEMESPTLALQMAQAALRMDGSTLDSELPEDTKRKLHAWLDANADAMQGGMPAAMMQRFEPWFVGLAISLAGMTQAGLDSKLGLDRHFADAAQAAGKPAGGFETGAQQIAFLDGMDRQEQLQFLDEALTDATDAGAQAEQLRLEWREGDADALWSGLAADMRRDYPQLYQHINVERNDAWLPKIQQRLDAPGSDDTLVVVGSLHLLGGDGLVEKLRGKGYRVERVCAACGR